MIFPLLYDELKRKAESALRRERANHTIQPTALVNEVYMRLAGQEVPPKDREHLIATAALMMSRILVDYARKHIRRPQGARVTLDEGAMAGQAQPIPLGPLTNALEILERADPDAHAVVVLKFYGGMTNEEIGKVMKHSVTTVKRRWRFAKAMLSQALSGEETLDVQV